MYFPKKVVKFNVLNQRCSWVLCTYQKKQLSFIYLPKEVDEFHVHTKRRSEV